ncbi:LacI family DNA-binding transcriptional regulator [Acidisoma sp. C75]
MKTVKAGSPPAAEPQAAGIRDLAAHLGISIGTISRALNNRPDVNPETRARVIAAAEKLGYTPQQSGRSLRKGITHRIGLLWEIPSGREAYGEPFFLSLFGGTQAVLGKRGYDLVVMLDQPGADDDPLARLRRIVQRREVDALILPWTRARDSRLDYLAETRLPFVALGRSLSGGAHPAIDLDFERAGEAAAGRFAAAGHQHIGIGLPEEALMQKRFFLAGFRQGLAAAGLALPDGAIAEGAVTAAGGYAIACRLLERSPRPTAILLIDSSMAVGLYRRLAELGLQAGRDVAVIGGVHDTPVTEFLVPALSCFTLDTAALGRRLAAVLLERLEGGAPAGGTELWPLDFLARQSDAWAG